MAALVVGEDPLLLLRHDTALLEARQNALHGALEVLLPDVLLIVARREDGRLVRDVREIGAGQAGGTAGEDRDVDVRAERLRARVDAQDLLTALQVGWGDVDLAVEATGAQQGRIEILEPVGGAHDHDLVGAAEPVHLDEKLVQGLVVLAVVGAARAGGADGVELVDEDDRRRVPARLLEELADPGGAEPGEHLDEGRCARRVEVRARFVRGSLREQRLARPGRAVEQNALGDARAEPLELLAVAEELDDLLQLLLRLVRTGDVVPADRVGRVPLDHRRLDLRHERHRAQEQPDDDAEEDDRQPRDQEAADVVDEWGQVTTACLSAGVRRTEGRPIRSYRRTATSARRSRRHPELDRRQQRVVQPRVAPGIGQSRVEPEVVENRGAAGSEEAEGRVDFVLRLAAVDEEEVERRLRREHLLPRAGEDRHVRIVGEDLRGSRCEDGIGLGTEERRLGPEGRHDPGRSDACTGADLRCAGDSAAGSEDVEERAVLRPTRLLEPQRRGERLRAKDERRRLHQTPRRDARRSS